MITAKTRFINSTFERNTNNYNANSPFKFKEDNIIFDKNLWMKIFDKWIGLEIVKIFGEPILENNVIFNVDPNIDNDDESNKKHNINFWIIYRLFNKWTAGNNWWHLLENSITIKIPSEEIKEMIEISDNIILHRVSTIENSVPCNDTFKTHPERLEIKQFPVPLTRQLLRDKMKCTDVGYFVKTQNTSTKKDYKPIEVYTPTDVLTHILGSIECNRVLYKEKEHYLLLSPWKEKLSLSNNEFRAFIIDGFVAGISQQNLYVISNDMLNVWAHMPEEIYQAVEKLYEDIKSKLSYEFQYDQCCLDVWVEQIDEVVIAHLIEINGRGYWGSAGSSLYNWETDPPIASKRELLIRY